MATDEHHHAQHPRGDLEFEVGLNPARLLQAISLCGSPQVAIAFRSAGKPVLVRPTDGEPANDYRHIVMPMRLTGPAPTAQR